MAFLDLLDPGATVERGARAEDGGASDRSARDPDAAFEHLYACFWETFDDEWLDKKASYMEFSRVMDSTKDRVRLALEKAGKARGGCTLEGVRDALGLDAMGA